MDGTLKCGLSLSVLPSYSTHWVVETGFTWLKMSLLLRWLRSRLDSGTIRDSRENHDNHES
jgi:hypothetical protein